MKSIAVIETDGSSVVAVQRGDLDLNRDKKARELAIADNRVGELDLGWNPEVLASHEVDLTQFWNENELNALLKGFRTNELHRNIRQVNRITRHDRLLLRLIRR